MNRNGWILVSVLIAGLGVLIFRLTGPSEPSVNSMTPPDLADVEDGEAIADVVLPESFSEIAMIGKRVFEAKCADCHGKNGAGQNGVAPPLVHRIYEPGHHGEGAFLSAAKNGVQSHHWDFGNMPPIEGLTGGDVKMIVAYVRELQRANGIN